MKKSDEIITIILYDHKKEEYVISDNTNSWTSGKASKVSCEDVSKFHKGLLELIASYLDSKTTP